MNKYFALLAALTAVTLLAGCGGGGGGSSTAGSGGSGGTTPTPAYKGTALITVDANTNKATITPLTASSRAVFTGSSLSFQTVQVNEDAGEVTARQLVPILQNNTGATVSNLRLTISGLTPVAAPIVDARGYVNVSSYAGTGSTGTTSGPRHGVAMGGPIGVWVDRLDNSVYVASSSNACIRKISNGVTSTVYSGGGILPYGITGDNQFLYFTDYSHQTVVRIGKDGSSPAIIAGTSGVAGDADGEAGTSKLSSPTSIITDFEGNLVVANLGTGSVRQILSPQGGSPTSVRIATVSGAYSLSDINPDGQEYYVVGQYSSVAKIYLVNAATGVATAITGTTGTSAVVGPANTVGMNLVRGMAWNGSQLVFTQAGRQGVYALSHTPGASLLDATTWNVVDFAGSGSAGSNDGVGVAAQFSNPGGVAVAADGSYLIGDTANNKIRSIITTNLPVLSGPGSSPASGSVAIATPDTYVANSDGTASPAFLFAKPIVGNGGTAALGTWNFTLSSGVTSFQFVVTIDGNPGFPGALDAVNILSATGSPLDYVRTLTRSAHGPNLFEGKLADIATPGKLLPCFAADGTAYLAAGSQILRVDTAGNVAPIVGTVIAGTSDGTGLSASFGNITAIACSADGSTIYVGDAGSIRRITGSGADPSNWQVTTIAGVAGTSGFVRGTGTASRFTSIGGLALSPNGKVLYASDTDNHAIAVLTPTFGNNPALASSWYCLTLAGNGSAGFSDGNGGQLHSPVGIATTATGEIIIADSQNFRVRKLTTGGVLSTLVGNGTNAFIDGVGTSSSVSPVFVAVGPSGYIYVGDINNAAIRRISPANELLTIVSGGTGIADGNGGTSGVGTGGVFSLAVSPQETLWFDASSVLRSVERIVGN